MAPRFAASFQEVTQRDGAQRARSSHAVAVVGRRAYAFGGEFQPRVPIDADVHVFDLDARRWSTAAASGDRPSAAPQPKLPCPRVGVAAAAVGPKLLVFGGRDEGHAELGEAYAFDTATGTWQLLASGAASPPARSYHSLAAGSDGKRVYTFGGCGESGRLNDLWVYDVDAGSWRQLPSSSSCVPRGGPGLVVLRDQVYVIFGFNGAELGDMHRFDLKTETWEEVLQGGEKPSPRSVFGVSTVGDRYIVLFGGEVDPSDQGHLGAGRFSDETYVFDTLSREWSKAEVTTTNGDKHPGGRGWFAAAPFDNGMLIAGGNSATNDRLDDMYLLDLVVS
eukprot:SM000260S09930  [mRNA]  locus=s260:29478:31061:+ [translate_table: standard]